METRYTYREIVSINKQFSEKDEINILRDVLCRRFFVTTILFLREAHACLKTAAGIKYKIAMDIFFIFN